MSHSPQLSASTGGTSRSSDDVVRDHLLRWRNRQVERDLARNYDGGVLSVTPARSYLGWSGAMAFEAELDARRRGCRLIVDMLRVGGSVAVASWSAADDDGVTRLRGVDSYYIRRGRILTQTREWVETGARDSAR
jgi:hypothetical protein